METYHFLRILKHYAPVREPEARELVSLRDAFPYSQVLHALSARVSKDHDFSNHQSVLQLAAVYAADRSVLKEVMETDPEDGEVSETISEREVKRGFAEVSQSADLATGILGELERLQKLRQNFELLFVDPNSISTQFIEEAPVEAPITLDNIQVSDKTEKENAAKSKKERIVELAKTVTAVHAPVIETEVASRLRRKKKDSTETILEQIAVSKEEIVPETEKHKEQIEIIDHFIRIQPSITGSREKPSASSDLSPVKTGEFSENVISETLVEILVKQGKREKAVEVLKKLIWKFPQKKAYFAAQIEELKN